MEPLNTSRPPDSNQSHEINSQSEKVAPTKKTHLGSVRRIINNLKLAFSGLFSRHKTSESESLSNKVVAESKNEAVERTVIPILLGQESQKASTYRSLTDTLNLPQPLSSAQLGHFADGLDKAINEYSLDGNAEGQEKLKAAGHKVMTQQLALADKHRIVASFTSPDEASRIAQQSRNVPLVKDGVQYLSSAYENFNSNASAEHELIGNIHANLNFISEIVGEIKSENNSLSSMTLQSFPKEYQPILESFISGEKKMTSEDVEKFKEYASNIRQASKGPPPEVPQSLRNAVKPIERQAKLQEVIRQGKNWGLQQPNQPEILGTSVNAVRKVLDTDGNLIGFYKMSKDQDTSTALIEHFMYDAAVVMGLENFFAPTGRMPLLTQSDLTEASVDGPKVKVIDDKGDLQTLTLLTHSVNRPKGSIQVAQKGVLLRDYLGNGGTLTKSELIKGSTTQIGMGMFDAHGANVIVDSDDRLNYFDNARSFPNSNRMLKYLGNNRLPFRSGLLGSTEMYTPLTEGDRAKLKEEADQWAVRAKQMREFVDLPATQKRLANLPSGWWSEAALNAMDERVKNMQTAASDPDVTNLRDFAFACYPEMKFCAAMYYGSCMKDFSDIKKTDENGFNLRDRQQLILPGLGFAPFDKMAAKAAELGIDLDTLKAKCEELPFDDVLHWIEHDYKQEKTPEEQVSIRGKVGKFIDDAAKHAVLELKDVSGSFQKELEATELKRIMSDYGVAVSNTLSKRTFGIKVAKDATNTPYVCVRQFDGSEQRLRLNTAKIFEEKISVLRDDQMEVDWKDYFKEATSQFPSFMFFIPYHQINESLQEGEWLIRSSEDGISDFTLSYKKDGVVHNALGYLTGGQILIGLDKALLTEVKNFDALLTEVKNFDALEEKLKESNLTPAKRKD